MSAAGRQRPALAPPEAWLSRWRVPEVVSVWVPGLYAWSATVALPCSEAQDGAAARWAAGGALLFLALGPPAVLVWGRGAASVALSGFVGSSAACWALLGAGLASRAQASAPEALGVVAWGAFSLGWGRFVHVALGPPSNPRLDSVLAPRAVVPLGPRIGFGALVLFSLALLLQAWRAPSSGALLVHGCALVSAASLVSVSARSLFASPGVRSPGQSLFPKVVWLVWAALGGLLWWVRQGA